MHAEGVQLLGRLLVVVALPREAHAHAARNPLNTLRPQELVELGVNTHVLRSDQRDMNEPQDQP